MLFERETYYTAIYHTSGLYGSEPPAVHDWAWHPHPATAEGRQALEDLRRLDLAASARALDLFGLKAEALAGLQAVLRPKKSALNGYLVAARFSLDLCRLADVRAAVDVADTLSPDNEIALMYRHDASLIGSGENVERRVRKIFGPRWPNQMIRVREKHDLQIRRLAWRARAATEGEQFTRFLKTERQWCEDERDRTMSGLDESAVPDSLRGLLPLARRYGVGDDPCRAYFISRTPKREQRQHLELAKPHLDDMQRWVATYRPESLPPEAAAFFWLLEALEEMRLSVQRRV